MGGLYSKLNLYKKQNLQSKNCEGVLLKDVYTYQNFIFPAAYQHIRSSKNPCLKREIFVSP